MDQQKSSSAIFTKRVQILLLLFCTLSSIVFILLHLMVIAKNGNETILSFFFKKEPHQHLPSPSEMIDYFKWSTESACKKRVYFGGPLFEQPSRKLTLVEGQKAVCLDDKVTPQINDCLVYSFGIRDDWYFEKSMAEHQGCNVSLFGLLLLQESQFTEVFTLFRFTRLII